MINKTCSIITDSNENYVGIVCEIDEIFMHVQIKNIMFVKTCVDKSSQVFY